MLNDPEQQARTLADEIVARAIDVGTRNPLAAKVDVAILLGGVSEAIAGVRSATRAATLAEAAGVAADACDDPPWAVADRIRSLTSVGYVGVRREVLAVLREAAAGCGAEERLSGCKAHIPCECANRIRAALDELGAM